MVPIPKPSSNDERPISLLQCMGKVMATLVQLRSTLRPPPLPPPLRVGARTRYHWRRYPGSPQHLHVQDDRRDGCPPSQSSSSISTKHSLRPITTSPLWDPWWTWVSADAYSPGLMIFFMINMTARVCVQGHFSEERPVQNGVPQGPILSPTLYNALMTSFIEPLTVSKGLEIVTYADDLAIIAKGGGKSAMTRAQTAIDRLVYTGPHL